MNRQWLYTAAVIGFVLAFMLTVVSNINPIGRVVDYVKNGSREARLSDYVDIKDITDDAKQVVVFDNFVEVRIGEFESKLTTYIVKEDGQVESTHMRPVLTYSYKDFNEDGRVDVYGISNNKRSRTVVSIHSKFVWNSIYAPYLPRFNKTQKYAGKELQERIDNDYALLRERGSRLNGTAYPPGGTWFEEYPVRLKSGEEPPFKITITVE